MNRKIGMISSCINVVSVIGFALCMVFGTYFGSYFVCMFIAFSFVGMMSTFAIRSSENRKAAGNCAMAFAVIYTVLVLLVYFAQVTTVHMEKLNTQARQILDYSSFGLMFNYDLLGYGIMALSTFFAGLTIQTKTKMDQWLKGLLLVHGVFFPASFVIPMCGLFQAGSQDSDWIGKVVLFSWCIYFVPVGIMSYLYFKKWEEIRSENR